MLLHHPSNKAAHEQPSNTWLKRLGWLGFMFFLIKGLLWLSLPGLLLYFGVE